MKTRLSVNVNKIATLRNARGGNIPNLYQFVKDIQKFGIHGVTVHPRPDERHITLKDTYEISKIVKTNYNIEGYPDERFIKIISEIKPEQATLVPDTHDVITSDQGWDTVKNKPLLRDVIKNLKSFGIKVSVFINPELEFVEGAFDCGADRIELYTGDYSSEYLTDKSNSIKKYVNASLKGKKLSMDVNAGHDLNLENLKYFKSQIPFLFEVSIGHALISDSIYYGIENTIKKYLSNLNYE